MTPPRLFVIGLDAMDASLARRMASEGRMPHLRRVFDRSTTALIENPEGLVVGSTWPSFATGVGPASHGMYCYRQLISGKYEIRRFNPYDIQATPYWDVLTDAGLKCTVFDFPLSRPTDKPVGAQIVDWGSHDRMLPSSVVSPLAAELIARHGPHPLQDKCDDLSRDSDWAGLLDILAAGADLRATMALDLLEQESWDVFTVVFGESHCAGHQFWGLHDPSHERHETDVLDALGTDPMEATYEACDAALGRLLDAAGPDTQVLVALSHGFGAHHDGDHLMAEILDRVEAARWPRPGWRRLREWAIRGTQRTTREVKNRVARSGGAVRVVNVDGSRSFLHIPNNEMYSGIRINLAGREPRGFIEPGTEYETLVSELSDELLDLHDPETGRPLVRAVLKTDDLHEGPYRSWLPDLFVDWERSEPINAAASPTIGVVTGSYSGVRTGDHRPSGLVAAMGRGIASGVVADPVRTMDLAPTICAAVGVDLPGAEGQPAMQLLPEAAIAD